MSEEDALRAVYAFVAEQMDNEVALEQILSLLVEEGLDRESAIAVVSNLIRMRSEALGKASMTNMILGALLCFGGIIATAIVHGVEATDGGYYIVAWGVVLCGALQITHGVLQSRFYRGDR